LQSDEENMNDQFRIVDPHDENVTNTRIDSYILPPKVASAVASQTQLELDEMNNSSHFLVPEEDRNRDVAKFHKHEVVLGDKLASGCFADVYEIHKFALSSKHQYDNNQDSARSVILESSEHSMALDDGFHGEGPTSDSSIASSVGSGFEYDDGLGDLSSTATGNSSTRTANTNSTPHKYVVKHLRPNLIEDLDTFKVGAADLTKEAQILASIQHPNIVSIRGWSSQGVSGYKSGHDGFFLVLDRLYETLHDRNKAWRKQVKRITLMPAKSFQNQQLLAERLKVCADIASAFSYLHERRLLYRDLKPQNLGFDIQGNIKLFDFGLAREIPKGGDDSSIDEVYELSGGTGSLRYMAPEVANYRPYNLKADVYGFTMVMYETLALKKPFEGYTPDMLQEKVFNCNGGKCGARPKLFSLAVTLSDDVVKLLHNGWAHNMKLRPTMQEAHVILRKAVKKQSIAVGGTTLPSFARPQRLNRRSSLTRSSSAMISSAATKQKQRPPASVDDDAVVPATGGKQSRKQGMKAFGRRGSCRF